MDQFELQLERRIDRHVSSVVRPVDPWAVTLRAIDAAKGRGGLRGWLDRRARPDVLPRGRPVTAVALLLVLVALLASSVLLVGGETAKPIPPLDWPDLGLRATGSLVEPRACHTAVLLDDGRVLVVGGRDIDGNVVTGAELFDPATGTFRALDASTLAGDGASATKLRDGRVLIAGGRGRLPERDSRGFCTMYDPAETNGDEELATASLFDPDTGRIEPTGDLTTPRSGHIAVLLADGRVLLAGGNGVNTDGIHGPLRSAELYDPRTGAFEGTGSLSAARGWQRARSGIMTPTAITLPDGRVVVTGGMYAPDEPNPDTIFETDDVYDPVTGRFTSKPSSGLPPTSGPWILRTNCRFPCLFRFDPAIGERSVARQGGPDGRYHGINGGSAWLLSDDRLLLVTGREVGLHDLVEGASWYADSIVSTYRGSATATALADGRVLIAGGTDVLTDEGPGFVTGAAEIAGPAEPE
jgi:hypothetical protein